MPEGSIGRQMLLLCAALALVAAGGMQVHLLGFSGAMTAPMVPALIGMALAGGLVASSLMSSKAAGKTVTNAQDEEHRPGAIDGDANVSGNPLLDDHFAGIKNELSQADRLAGDAVGELVESFKHIGRLTRLQQDISLAIAAAAAPVEPMGQLLERQAMVAGQIEQEVDAAVTALQFGDLLAQLLNHAMIRVDAIAAAPQRIGLPDTGQDGGEHSCRQFHDRVSKGVLLANTASRRRPAMGHEMQTGSVELF